MPFGLSIGPQRCGTSWLDRYLRTRSDVCLPYDVKEVFFFDRLYTRGDAFYYSHFRPQTGQALAMEVSTTAFDNELAPQHVLETMGPDITLLCPLRHPVERSYSLYQHYRRYGLVKGNLREACAINPQIINSSRYARHLENWLKAFKRTQFKFVFQEDLALSPTLFVREVCRKLGIPYIPPGQDILPRYNGSSDQSPSPLAGLAQKAATYLRDRQMHGVINAAKAAGLKKALFGADNSLDQENMMSAADREWLESKLEGEIEAAEKIIGPVPQWHLF